MIVQPDLRRVVDDVLGDAAASAADPDGAASADALWALLTELGWPLVGVQEDSGGSGGELADVAELAAGAGRHAVPVPLVETGLAAWVLDEAGLPVAAAAGRATVAFAGTTLDVRPAEPGAQADAWRLDGTVDDVRWLPGVARVVVVAATGDGSTLVAALDTAGTAGLTIDASHNLADEPVGTLRLAGVAVPAQSAALAPPRLAEAARERAALLRAAAISGAVERACELAKDHVAARHQFGRPLSALPAVRQLVAGLAVERDLLDGALAVALERPGAGTVAAARALAASCAGAVATGAHQLHGAIGVTREYPLHRVTRRLWAWRDEDGTQRRWEELVGAEVLGGDGDDRLWSLVTGAPLDAPAPA